MVSRSTTIALIITVPTIAHRGWHGRHLSDIIKDITTLSTLPMPTAKRSFPCFLDLLGALLRIALGVRLRYEQVNKDKDPPTPRRCIIYNKFIKRTNDQDS